jgi:hypothetical protein
MEKPAAVPDRDRLPRPLFDSVLRVEEARRRNAGREGHAGDARGQDINPKGRSPFEKGTRKGDRPHFSQADGFPFEKGSVPYFEKGVCPYFAIS